jgi:hypothetical protein
MGSYVSRDAKNYVLTEEGLRLLREVDTKYAKIPAHSSEEKVRDYSDEGARTSSAPGEPSAQRDHSKFRRVAVFAGLATLGSAGIVYAFLGSFAFMALADNISLILFVVLALALASSFSFKGRWIFPQTIGYRGLMLPVLAVAVIFSGIMFLSQATFTGAAVPHYDNSMDALLSTYSLHWQVR